MAPGNRYAFRLRPGMRHGYQAETPIPTRLVSNEEFPPLPQTAAQRRVEERILADATRLAPRLGLSRRDFLHTSGGVATSLLAMNAVFGRFWDVRPVEAADPAAFKAGSGDPYFIFDVQLHYVGAGVRSAQRGSGPPGRGEQGRAARAAPGLAADSTRSSLPIAGPWKTWRGRTWSRRSSSTARPTSGSSRRRRARIPRRPWCLRRR